MSFIVTLPNPRFIRFCRTVECLTVSNVLESSANIAMVISSRFTDFRMPSRNFSKIVVVEWGFRNPDIGVLGMFSFLMNSHI